MRLISGISFTKFEEAIAQPLWAEKPQTTLMPLTRSPGTRLGARLDVLIDRLALRLSRGQRIDGLWVGCFLVKDFSRAFDRVEEALRLIRVHDPLRYKRLTRDLDRLWVSVLPGNYGEFRRELKLCILDERFVLGDATQPQQIAATIVHEAAHARLMRCGIGYHAELRTRVEAVCFRRERAFAAKLPNGEQARDDAQRRLMGYPSDYWTNEVSCDRFEQGNADALRYLGAPEFLIRVVLGLRRLIRGIRHCGWRLRRTGSP